MDFIFDLMKTCRRCDYQGGVRGNEDVFHPRGDCRHSNGQWRGDPNDFFHFSAFLRFEAIWQTDVYELQNYLFLKI